MKLIISILFTFYGLCYLNAQSSWVTKDVTSAWGSHYGIPIDLCGFLVPGYAMQSDAFYTYDASGNRTLKYYLCDLGKVANTDKDKAIGQDKQQLLELQKLYDANVRVFPNPTSEKIFVAFPKEKMSNAVLTLYTINGQSVKSIKNTTGHDIFDVAELPAGFYSLILRSNEVTLSWKINKI